MKAARRRVYRLTTQKEGQGERVLLNGTVTQYEIRKGPEPNGKQEWRLYNGPKAWPPAKTKAALLGWLKAFLMEVGDRLEKER